jgi:hypothetical protein
MHGRAQSRCITLVSPPSDNPISACTVHGASGLALLPVGDSVERQARARHVVTENANFGQGTQEAPRRAPGKPRRFLRSLPVAARVLY